MRRTLPVPIAQDDRRVLDFKPGVLNEETVKAIAALQKKYALKRQMRRVRSIAP